MLMYEFFFFHVFGGLVPASQMKWQIRIYTTHRHSESRKTTTTCEYNTNCSPSEQHFGNIPFHTRKRIHLLCLVLRLMQWSSSILCCCAVWFEMDEERRSQQTIQFPLFIHAGRKSFASSTPHAQLNSFVQLDYTVILSGFCCWW